MTSAITGGIALHRHGLRGFVYKADDLAERLVVELLVDGWGGDVARAADFAPEAADIGDGCYGFGFELPEPLAGEGSVVEVRVANSGEPVGDPIRLPSAAETERAAAGGRVVWRGGLRLTGWVEAASDGEPGVVAVIERREVADCAARGWASVRQGSVRTVMAAFDLHLPVAYADGRVHRVTVLDRDGRRLAGSPCAVLAFPDGLRDHLLRHQDADPDDPRVAFIARYLPQSLPFEAWAEREARRVPADAGEGAGPAGPVAVLLVGDDADASIASLDLQRGVNWVALQTGVGAGAGCFSPGELRAGLAAETDAATVVVALAGTEFRPGGLAELSEASRRHAAPVYADVLLRRDGGDLPILWPAYDAERQLEQGYAAFVFAAPRAAVLEALGGGAASIFALLLALAGETAPFHLPTVVARLPPLAPGLSLALARAGAARITGAVAAAAVPAGAFPALHLRRAAGAAEVGVAVIQPQGAALDLDALSGLLGRAVRDAIVVSHEVRSVPRGWRALTVPGWRNPSRLRNAAIHGATTARLLLIDAGVQPLDAAALAELEGRMAAERVAAVSGTLFDPEGIVLSAGMVLGPGYDVVPAFEGARHGEPGYGGALWVARGCGALDGRCLMLDRAMAARAGGFDDVAFPERYGAADLGLRLRQAGGRLLVTPQARFVEITPWRAPAPAAREAERDRFRQRWAERLVDDPFYHPGLNRDGRPFAGLAWPPLPSGPRRPEPWLSETDEQR